MSPAANEQSGQEEASVAEAPSPAPAGRPRQQAQQERGPVIPQRPMPAGKPSPTAVCGHAVAFAGWRPTGNHDETLILVVDPGDNTLEDVGHVWESRPREVPLHFGTRRPGIVLLPAGGFTITGAVVVVPRDVDVSGPLAEPVAAERMPDLSQNFDSRWPGLCGPTSGADILYCIDRTEQGQLSGFPRGPAARADEAAVRLIVGGRGEGIGPESLAGRMGVGPSGDGATNIGLRNGMDSWLAERDPDGWQVELEWLDDARRTPAEQEAFVGRLAAAVHAGGGAILCLWPGLEFADAAVDDAAAEQQQSAPAAAETLAVSAAGQDQEVSRTQRPEEPLPSADFPAVPRDSAEVRTPDLPGRGADREADPESALVEARRKLTRAEERLTKGDVRSAMDLATAAVERLVGPAARDDACRAELQHALNLCRRIDGVLPASEASGDGRPIQFK